MYIIILFNYTYNMSMYAFTYTFETLKRVVWVVHMLKVISIY